MTTQNEKEISDVTNLIDNIKKRRLVGFISFVICFLLGISSVFMGDITNTRSIMLFFTIFLVGIALSSLIRVFTTKCPACKKLFYGAPIRALYASSCYYCRLGKSTTQQKDSSNSDSAAAKPE